MQQTKLLFEIANQNLLLGFIPESLGLLIFGIGLVALTFGLRWVLKRVETQKVDSNSERVN